MRSLCLCASLRLSASLFISLFFSPFFCSMRLCPSLRLSCILCFFSVYLRLLYVSVRLSACIWCLCIFFRLSAPLCVPLLLCASIFISLFFCLFSALFSHFFWVPCSMRFCPSLYSLLFLGVPASSLRLCVASLHVSGVSAFPVCLFYASQSLSVSLLFLGVSVSSPLRLCVASLHVSGLCVCSMSSQLLSVSLLFLGVSVSSHLLFFPCAPLPSSFRCPYNSPYVSLLPFFRLFFDFFRPIFSRPFFAPCVSTTL